MIGSSLLRRGCIEWVRIAMGAIILVRSTIISRRTTFSWVRIMRVCIVHMTIVLTVSIGVIHEQKLTIEFRSKITII